MSNKKSGAEQRKARRTVVQESFQLYLVIPKMHGMVRVYLRDISQLGLCFSSEMPSSFQMGQSVNVRIYINPSFYLPLDCKVVRILPAEVALEFEDPTCASAQALARLQEFLEAAEKGAVLVE